MTDTCAVQYYSMRFHMVNAIRTVHAQFACGRHGRLRLRAHRLPRRRSENASGLMRLYLLLVSAPSRSVNYVNLNCLFFISMHLLLTEVRSEDVGTVFRRGAVDLGIGVPRRGRERRGRRRAAARTHFPP